MACHCYFGQIYVFWLVWIFNNNLKDCLTTARRLPDDCLTTAWWLPEGSFINAWRLSEYWLMTAKWLLYDYLMTAWLDTNSNKMMTTKLQAHEAASSWVQAKEYQYWQPKSLYRSRAGRTSLRDVGCVYSRAIHNCLWMFSLFEGIFFIFLETKKIKKIV